MSEENDELHRHLVVASVSYQPVAPTSEYDIWCAEIRYADDDVMYQGWGADPLGAALKLAETLYFELIEAAANGENGVKE